ncbi:hypothetical protein E4T42_02090 [Aureobasidium subglaciale]|nr:hypothetical protein E4T42_02090 [Aureobasidium subglaciale]
MCSPSHSLVAEQRKRSRGFVHMSFNDVDKDGTVLNSRNRPTFLLFVFLGAERIPFHCDNFRDNEVCDDAFEWTPSLQLVCYALSQSPAEMTITKLRRAWISLQLVRAI